MAPRVYTTQFLLQQVNDSAASYTVAAGYRAVITDVEVCIAESTALAFVVVAVGELPVVAGTPTPTGGFAQFTWQGRIAVNAGQTFAVECDQLAALIVTGYLFLAP